MNRHQPPRLISALLSAVLPGNIHGRSILGDLHEEFEGIATSSGLGRARLWYVWQGVVLVTTYVRPGRSWFTALSRDAVRATRGLVRTPSFTASVVGSIALAVGAGTAVFSVVDTVLLRPLPFEAPEQLFRIWASDQENGETQLDLSYPEALSLLATIPAFSNAGGFSIAPRTLLNDEGGNPEEIRVARTLGDPLGTLGVRTTRGRLFSDQEADQGLPVVVMSHRLWDSRFAQDPEILGSPIYVEDQSYQVVGVLQRDADLAEGIDLWRPLSSEETEDDDREVYTLGRLAAGTSVLALQEQLLGFDRSLTEQDLRPDHVQSWTQSLHGVVVGDVRTTLWAFLGAVGLLLVATCANTANLLVSRTSRRSHDTAVRRSLGAAGWQVTRFQIIESLILGFLGGALGLGLGAWILDLLLSSAPPVPRLQSVVLDARAAMVVLGVTIASGLLAAIGPSLAALKRAPADLMRSSKSTGTPEKRFGQSALVFTEVSLSTVLTVLAFILFATFQNVSRFNRGFVHDDLYTVTLEPERHFGSAEERATLFNQILENVNNTPGIQGAALASHPILEQRGFSFDMTVQREDGPHTDAATLRIVSAEFFQTAGIQVQTGRGFSPAPADRAGELIVNEAFVRSHLVNNARPVGTEVSASMLEGRIVGVVSDVSPHPSEPARPIVYLPFSTLPLSGAQLFFRSEAGASVSPQLWEAIHAAEPATLQSTTESVAATLVDARFSERFNMAVAVLFSTMALGLAAIGVYGIMNHLVTTRRKEIGIRRALGAPVSTLAWDVFTASLRLVVFAIVVGLGVAIAGQRWVGSMLVDTAPGDPLIVVGVALTLLGVASLSALIPIWKASAIPPTEALIGE